MQRSGSDRYLHLICFVTHQCFRLQDALVDILLATVQSVTGTCDREHKELYFNGRDERKQTIRRFLNRLDEGAFAPLTNIETIAFDKGLQDSDKVQQIRNVLVAAKAARESASENLDGLRARNWSDTPMMPSTFALEARSIKLQNRVSEIVKCVEFHGTESGLLEAIHHYQLRDAVITQHSPVAFLPADEQESLYDDDGKMRVSLYKALLFLRVANAVKSGALNISLSYKYRSLDDYLIPRADWEANRKEYVTRAELDGVADCGFRLAQISETLHSRYVHTNRRVLGGENEHVRFFKDGSFHVITPKAEQEDSEPLGFVFPEKRYISLLEVLSTVNRASGFVDAFEHWQTKYSRSRPPDRAFYAGIIGLGCFIGTRKMAQISSQIDAFELENTVNSRFSVENVDAANDRLLAFMGSLPLTDVYRREPDNLHTSSDGQKYEVAVDSLNANYSFKYFGQGKGVAAYNFIDERHFLFHSTVISSSEREAAYVIDGLMHNDVVKSDIHSTDTHGYSEVVFGVMDLLGFSFAPRLKNLKGKVLYSFQEHRRKDYEQQECRILPSKYVDEGLVHRYWDDILRLSATIKLKHATASQIFRRLNSYSTQHPLYAAIKEYGRPLVSDFILRYVDQMGFRQSIEKQLNKLESSNKFSRAVGFGSEEFLQGEKVEQEIAEGCRRLIKNSVVCWNYLYLSQLLADEDDPKQRAQLLAAIKNGSVVTWQHINLHGEYDFSDAKLRDSVGLEAPKLKAFSLG
ncbi:MAG: Tn3 family transposase [Pirellulaceae bacterium]